PIADMALALADDAVDEDNYPAALRLLEIAKAAASKLNSITAYKQINARIREVTEIQKEYGYAKAAVETLIKSPDDAEANCRWGRFICLFKGSWSKGIPLLAQGSDRKLKEVAEKELAKPTNATERVDLGNAYLSLAENEQSQIAKRALRARAKDWFDQESPGLLE